MILQNYNTYCIGYSSVTWMSKLCVRKEQFDEHLHWSRFSQLLHHLYILAKYYLRLPLLLSHCCHLIVTTLLSPCWIVVTLLLPHCCHIVVVTLLLSPCCCHIVVTLLSHCCHIVVVTLLSPCCWIVAISKDSNCERPCRRCCPVEVISCT